MDRRSYLRVTAGLSAAGLGGCLGVGATTDDYDVGMSTVAFRPEEYTASVGDTVVWHNTSKQGHTVTAYDDGQPDGATYFASGGFESEDAARSAWRDRSGGTLAQGQSYEHTFETPGTHVYVCIPHESRGMVGRVVVEE